MLPLKKDQQRNRSLRLGFLAIATASMLLVITIFGPPIVSAASSTVLISAGCHNPHHLGEHDELFRLTNVSVNAMDLSS